MPASNAFSGLSLEVAIDSVWKRRVSSLQEIQKLKPSVSMKSGDAYRHYPFNPILDELGKACLNLNCQDFASIYLLP